MHQNGEYHDPALGKQMPRNRQKARELLQRGADLGHVLALYHLGLAYKNGSLGLNDDLDAEGVSIANRGSGKAFQHLSKAAETGFLPAMIETALALRGDWGLAADGDAAGASQSHAQALAELPAPLDQCRPRRRFSSPRQSGIIL